MILETRLIESVEKWIDSSNMEPSEMDFKAIAGSVLKSKYWIYVSVKVQWGKYLIAANTKETI